MSKIPTAEEILKNSETWEEDYSTVSKYDAEQAMIEFAKLHVQKALESAAKNGKAHHTYPWNRSDPYVIESSILESYPLENIK